MARSIVGRGFGLDGSDGMITFFSWTARPGRKEWYTNTGTFDSDGQPSAPSIPVRKASVKGDILAVLDGLDGDRARDARMVIVHPNDACMLYLDGVITTDHLNKAVATVNHIDLPGVRFSRHTLTIRVWAAADGAPIIAKADGTPLE